MYQFPDLLTQLHQIDFYEDEDEDEDEDENLDFEPYQHFLSEEETQGWFKSWTGNNEADSNQLLIFGQDGSGGYTAFWLVNHQKDTLEQPIVFLGSEGEIGVVAKNFDDYLWLLAQNYGAHEAVISFPKRPVKENIKFLNFAQKHAKSSYRTVTDIINDAKNTYPTFEKWIDHLTR